MQLSHCEGPPTFHIYRFHYRHLLFNPSVQKHIIKVLPPTINPNSTPPNFRVIPTISTNKQLQHKENPLQRAQPAEDLKHPSKHKCISGLYLVYSSNTGRKWRNDNMGAGGVPQISISKCPQRQEDIASDSYHSIRVDTESQDNYVFESLSVRWVAVTAETICQCAHS